MRVHIKNDTGTQSYRNDTGFDVAFLIKETETTVYPDYLNIQCIIWEQYTVWSQLSGKIPQKSSKNQCFNKYFFQLF